MSQSIHLKLMKNLLKDMEIQRMIIIMNIITVKYLITYFVITVYIIE